MNDEDYSSDYLMHYGVLGMKWGVRKQKPSSGSSSRSSGSSASASSNQNASSSSGGSRNALKESIKQKIRESRAASKEKKLTKKEQKKIEKAEKKEEKRLEKGRKDPSKLKEEDLDKLISKMNKEVEVKRLQRELASPSKKSAPKQINMQQQASAVTPKQKSRGRRMVEDVMFSAGKTVLTTAAIGAATYAVNRYVGTKNKSLANQMAPLRGSGDSNQSSSKKSTNVRKVKVKKG